MDFNTWKNNVLDTVNDFIDHKYWFDTSGKIISDPVETNVILFNDFSIENFLEDHSKDLTEAQRKYGYELIDAINQNDHWFEKIPLEELVVHPDFLKIKKAAENFYNSFGNDD